MLSMSNVGGGQAASGYYKAEGYYLEGSVEAQHASRYIGEGARSAGLHGQVDDDKFTQLLDGETPAGTRIGRMRDGEWEHRSGLDLTFSAPKSASIAALVGGDQAVIDAHSAAVDATISYIEKNVVQTRQYIHGEKELVTGGKLVGGAFQHDTSRAMDPHLHTHVVLANMVLCDDGRYRALHNDELYKQTLIIGQVYRNHFASTLKESGYNVQYDTKTGFFELGSVAKEVVETFSTRRNDIVSALDERGLEATARNSQLAALATRATKAPVERAELYQTWRDVAEKLNFTFEKPQVQDQERAATIAKSADKTELAKESVDFAVAHLSERAAVYPLKDTVLTAMRQRPSVSVDQISSQIVDRVVNHDLFYLNGKDGPNLTDKQTIQTEQANIRAMNELKGGAQIDVRSVRDKLSLRTPEGAVAFRLAPSTLTDGQKESVAMILTSEDRLVGVQGLAGTGKTYMLSTAGSHLEKAGYQIEGIAASHKAVSQLEEAIPASRTIASALVRHANVPLEGDKSKTVLVVDEASMLSSADMRSVLTLAQQKGYARVVLVGDVRQLDAPGAGPSFRQLQDNGMPTSQMLDIQRQHSAEGREAVLRAASGDVVAAMSGISKVHIPERDKETPAPDRRITRSEVAQEVAKQYLGRSDEDRAKTGVIVSTNAMRTEVNEAIQAGLKEADVLKGEGHTFASLSNKNFTAAEAAEVASYSTGDIILAIKPIKSAAMEAGGLYRVNGVDAENRTLTLVSSEGRTSTLTLTSQIGAGNKLAVFEEAKQTVFAGDTVKFRITDRENGIVNANTGTVITVGKTEISIRNDRGERQDIPRESLAAKGMQLSYASTAHDFQGSSVDRVLMAMYSDEFLATQKTLYVDMSRMKYDTELVTDDVEKLVGNIQKHTGERVLALESLGSLNAAERAAVRDIETETLRDIAQASQRPYSRFQTPPEQPQGQGAESASAAPEYARSEAELSSKKAADQAAPDEPKYARTRAELDGEKPDQKPLVLGAEMDRKSEPQKAPENDKTDERNITPVKTEEERQKSLDDAKDMLKDADAKSQEIRNELDQLQRGQRTR